MHRGRGVERGREGSRGVEREVERGVERDWPNAQRMQTKKKKKKESSTVSASEGSSSEKVSTAHNRINCRGTTPCSCSMSRSSWSKSD